MRRDRISWCLFDFANSAFNTVVITFVYFAWFKHLAGEEVRGETLWANTQTIAGIAIALISPALGASADRGRHRKRGLVLSSLACIACTGLLFFPSEDGGAAALWSAFALVVCASIAFEVAFVFYNAFLPQLGDSQTIGRLSGYGWACGYAGGLVCLALCLGFVGFPSEAPVVGPWLPTDGGFNVRATTLLVAAWFLVFALPMFVWVREPPAAAGDGVTGFRAVLRTLREMRSFPDLLRLFVAHLFYNDGLMAIIGLAALYMSGTLGMGEGDIAACGIWLNVAAGLGAVGFGFVDDRVGSKAAIGWSLVLLVAGLGFALAVPTVTAFWIAATLIGIGMGPNQSASRTMLARMVPPRRSAEFYGLFALSGKATVWMGPLLFALIRPHVDDQRLAFLPVIGLLGLGFVLVLLVDERRGIARANAP